MARKTSAPIINLEKYGAKLSENPIGINCPCSNIFVIPNIGVGYNFAKADNKNKAEINTLKENTR